MQYTKEVEDMICVAKGPNHGPAPIPEDRIMVLLRFLKRENGFRRKKLRTFPVTRTASAGVLLSREPAS